MLSALFAGGRAWADDTKAKIDESDLPVAGLVDDAAVHEIPALPSDEEVAAIAAEHARAARCGEGVQRTAGQRARSGGSSFAAPEPSSVKWACRVAAQLGIIATGRLAACVG